jgi:hypothetical protein
MDLPELGSVSGAWDLRPTIDAYLGHFDFSGKRCLDVRAASGYLIFEMERRGATEVVSVDLDPDRHEWEVVPFAAPIRDMEADLARTTETIIVTQQAPGMADAYAYFMPDPTTQEPWNAWWSMSEACTERMLGVLGFKTISKTQVEHHCPERGDYEACTAIVAQRMT